VLRSRPLKIEPRQSLKSWIMLRRSNREAKLRFLLVVTLQ
jgi:hypothetical protein